MGKAIQLLRRLKGLKIASKRDAESLSGTLNMSPLCQCKCRKSIK